MRATSKSRMTEHNSRIIRNRMDYQLRGRWPEVGVYECRVCLQRMPRLLITVASLPGKQIQFESLIKIQIQHPLFVFIDICYLMSCQLGCVITK